MYKFQFGDMLIGFNCSTNKWKAIEFHHIEGQIVFDIFGYKYKKGNYISYDEFFKKFPNAKSEKFFSEEKVLVRNSEDKFWKYGFYSHFDYENKEHHILHFGNYKYCIKFQGNENLNHTCKEAV